MSATEYPLENIYHVMCASNYLQIKTLVHERAQSIITGKCFYCLTVLSHCMDVKLSAEPAGVTVTGMCTNALIWHLQQVYQGSHPGEPNQADKSDTRRCKVRAGPWISTPSSRETPANPGTMMGWVDEMSRFRDGLCHKRLECQSGMNCQQR